MKMLSQPLFVAGYFLVALFVPELIEGESAVWVEAVLAVTFVILSTRIFTKNKYVSLAMVAMATFVLPMTVLVMIGLTAYPGWKEMYEAFVSVDGYYGPSAFVDMLIPLGVAAITYLIVAIGASNSPLHTDASRQ
jgi:hypothetical protein